ncbi:MAG: hypothetical protein BM556_03185 [Bacteriovorax sp. MedPE-SWde]|nr:MAG: hypothetical protein BM556_03185 [Bacteriovorax sp. MedPE-SWde]
MSIEKHPNELVNDFISNSIMGLAGLKLTQCDKKETIVLEEKETTYIYSFRKDGSDTLVNIALSDPLYFCDVSFAKNENDYFNLKPYLKTIGESQNLESLFDFFLDEKVSEEEYVLGFLNIFKSMAENPEIQQIISGEYWPDVPKDEE